MPDATAVSQGVGVSFFKRHSVVVHLKAPSVEALGEEEWRGEYLRDVFTKLDVVGNGHLEFPIIESVLGRGDQSKAERRIMAKLRAALKAIGSEGALGVKDFQLLISQLSRHKSHNEFTEYVDELIDGYEEAVSDPSRRRSHAVWDLFHKMDYTMSGKVRVDSIHKLLAKHPMYKSSKTMRKKSHVAQAGSSENLMDLKRFGDFLKEVFKTCSHEDFDECISELCDSFGEENMASSDNIADPNGWTQSASWRLSDGFSFGVSSSQELPKRVIDEEYIDTITNPLNKEGGGGLILANMVRHSGDETIDLCLLVCCMENALTQMLNAPEPAHVRRHFTVLEQLSQTAVISNKLSLEKQYAAALAERLFASWKGPAEFSNRFLADYYCLRAMSTPEKTRFVQRLLFLKTDYDDSGYLDGEEAAELVSSLRLSCPTLDYPTLCETWCDALGTAGSNGLTREKFCDCTDKCLSDIPSEEERYRVMAKIWLKVNRPSPLGGLRFLQPTSSASTNDSNTVTASARGKIQLVHGRSDDTCRHVAVQTELPERTTVTPTMVQRITTPAVSQPPDTLASPPKSVSLAPAPPRPGPSAAPRATPNYTATATHDSVEVIMNSPQQLTTGASLRAQWLPPGPQRADVPKGVIEKAHNGYGMSTGNDDLGQLVPKVASKPTPPRSIPKSPSPHGLLHMTSGPLTDFTVSSLSQLLTSGQVLTDDLLRSEFKKLDRDSQGYISRHEFRRICAAIENFGMPGNAVEPLLEKYCPAGRVEYDVFALIVFNLALR